MVVVLRGTPPADIAWVSPAPYPAGMLLHSPCAAPPGVEPLDLRRRVRDFVASGARLIELPRDPGVDVISQWRLVRPAPRTIAQHVVLRLCNLSPWMGLKRSLLRQLVGLRVGVGAALAPAEICPVFPDLITIEQGAAVGWHALLVCHLFTPSRVIVGRVHIGARAVVGGYAKVMPGVIVEEDARIDLGAVLCPGVRVGRGAVVRPGSVVEHDVPPGEIWQGVPAACVRRPDAPPPG